MKKNQKQWGNGKKPNYRNAYIDNGSLYMPLPEKQRMVGVGSNDKNIEDNKKVGDKVRAKAPCTVVCRFAQTAQAFE